MNLNKKRLQAISIPMEIKILPIVFSYKYYLLIAILPVFIYSIAALSCLSYFRLTISL